MIPTHSASAQASPNIAFIKYWGNINPSLNLPVNGSISMNLDGLITTTKVTFDPFLEADQLWINDAPIEGPPLQRVSRFLGAARRLANVQTHATVRSHNNFPASAGLASSASAFAALALAATRALELALPEPALSALARLGSGSAARSVPGGFVEWYAGDTHESSYAQTIAPPDHWDLVDVIAIVQEQEKATGSTKGHALAPSSPLQQARAKSAPERLQICRRAILARDFDAFAGVVELDSNLMHAAMMTSQPPLFYWEPATLAIMMAVPTWRKQGLQVCYTIDAGANVHLLCSGQSANDIVKMAGEISGVQRTLRASPGPAAKVVE